MKKNFLHLLTKLVKGNGVIKPVDLASSILVSEAAVSQWISGRTFPRAEHLNAIITSLELYPDLRVKNLLKEFHEYAAEPLDKILPAEVTKRLTGYYSLNHYLNNRSIEVLTHDLAFLNGALAKELIIAFSQISREVKRELDMGAQTIDTNLYKAAIRKLGQGAFTEILKNQTLIKSKQRLVAPKIINLDSDKENLEENRGLLLLESLFPVEADKKKVKILFWNFKAEENQNISHIEADEILFLKLKGAIKWVIEGMDPIDLKDNNLVWLKNQKSSNDVFGFPNSTLIPEEDGFGILVLYKKTGIKFAATRNYDIPGFEKVFSFSYKQPSFDANDIRSIHKAVLQIETAPSSLMTFLDTYANPKRKDNHQNQRVEKQLRDVRLDEIDDYTKQGWPKLRESNFSVTLLKFGQADPEHLEYGRHPGFEIIIPLSNTLHFSYTNVVDDDSNTSRFPYLSVDLPDRSNQNIDGFIDTPHLPSIIALDSNLPHTFMSQNKWCTCLLIRILADPKQDPFFDERYSENELNESYITSATDPHFNQRDK